MISTTVVSAKIRIVYTVLSMSMVRRLGDDLKVTFNSTLAIHKYRLATPTRERSVRPTSNH